MAIDSKAKRMSMLSFASPLAWQHHYEVDGTVNADDRFNLLHLYGGFVSSSDGGGDGGLMPALFNRRRRFRSGGHRFRRGRN